MNTYVKLILKFVTRNTVAKKLVIKGLVNVPVLPSDFQVLNYLHKVALKPNPIGIIII